MTAEDASRGSTFDPLSDEDRLLAFRLCAAVSAATYAGDIGEGLAAMLAEVFDVSTVASELGYSIEKLAWSLRAGR